MRDDASLVVSSRTSPTGVRKVSPPPAPAVPASASAAATSADADAATDGRRCDTDAVLQVVAVAVVAVALVAVASVAVAVVAVAMVPVVARYPRVICLVGTAGR